MSTFTRPLAAAACAIACALSFGLLPAAAMHHGGKAETEAETPEPVRTGSGLQITHLAEGTGSAPTATSRVTVHYTGRFVNGEVFDSSVERGQPATFPLSGVIPCWTEALQLMQVGGKAHLVCPSRIAYGMRGAPPSIPPGATLHFEVELLAVEP